MYLIFVQISLLTLFLYRIVATENCDNSICNNEAVCILINQTSTCDCVGEFFEGKFCSKPVDHCQSNPCQNGGICHPYPGHYYCQCTDGYSAQKCTSKQDTFKGLHLHYNHIAPLGQEQSLIIMLQSIGTVETLMEFTTPEFIIDGFMFRSGSVHFKKSNDLRALGKSLGIRNSNKLPYNRGFYRVSHGTFWQLGLHAMTLDLSDSELTAENFFNADFYISIYDPSRGRGCHPVLYLPYCSTFRRLLHIDIAKFNFIEPIVEKRCAENSHLKVKWSVRNYINTVVLHKFPEVSSTVLTIPPYTMWFNYSDDYIQLYLIQGDVSEEIPRRKYTKKSILRCYAMVDTKETSAVIIGGAYREVNVGKAFEIDGSISRDYARHPRRNQLLKYTWSCESDDTNNRHCLRNMGSQSRLRIPRRALKLDQTYAYTLRIRSTVNIFSTDRVSQQIKAVSRDPLLIHFVCVRNCDRKLFAAGKIIHLKIECVKCPRGNIVYSVRNEQDVEVTTSHSVTLTGESNELTLKAEASLGSRKGSSSITLTLNNPPAKGSCTISPTSGIEYQTIFEISCPGYEDDKLPLSYKYKAGNITLDQNGIDTLLTRLFPTSGRNCEIKISICDDLGACIDVELQATLSPFSPNGSWLDLLSEKETNLKELVVNGDRPAFIVLIQTVILHIPTGDGFEITEHIVESLRDLKISRLLAVEQVLTIGSELFDAIELSSDSVILVSELFSKVADGLLLSIRNEEVHELQLENFEEMIEELLQSMAREATGDEEFPMVHVAEPIPPEDPFMENYPDYGELNMKDVVHISNWLTAFNRMHRCLQIMGVVSAFVKFPGEAPTMTEKNGVTSKTLVIEKSGSTSLSWNQSSTFVNLPNEFLNSLSGSEIAIQVSIFEANPFWWNPEQYKVNTEVLSVGAYTKDLKSLNPSLTKVAFSFLMAFKGNTEIEDGNILHGTVKNSLDMIVYERPLPAHAVLVVTVLPLNNNIQILLTIDKKPRSYMFKEATKIKASNDNTTLFLVNRNSKQGVAFLAIMAASYTHFSFAMNARLCLTWNPLTYEWTSKHCTVGSQTNATHIHCSCWHLSMFAAKVHPTTAYLQLPKGIVKDLTFNYGMIVLYVIIIIFLCLVLLIAWRRDMAKATGLIALNSKPRTRAAYKYVVTIYTNGHTNAGTTSNVTIQLQGSLSDSTQYTLYSNPSHLLFQRNGQESFAILSSTSMGTLQSVSLSHDSFGRYPSWNCHMIKVRDEANQNEYVFLVNKWLSDTESTSCTIFLPLDKKKNLQKRKRIFRDTLTDAFANWYAQQAICDQRLYGTLTATEKTAIFIVRACITLVGTIVIFGPTTLYTYEEERETYYSMLLDIGRILLIACCCHLVGVLVAAALQILFLNFRIRS